MTKFVSRGLMVIRVLSYCAISSSPKKRIVFSCRRSDQEEAEAGITETTSR
jgi:hypothetical protein